MVKYWHHPRSKVNSPWNCALVIAPKEDITVNRTGWRIYIDHRNINILIPDANFPLPIIREILEELANAVVYTKLDLEQGFNQFGVHPDDQVKTTFTWKNLQYHFIGAPFGFTNVLSTFQMVISNSFGDLLFVQTYIDDIIIFSRPHEADAAHVSEAIRRLNNINLRINADKATGGPTIGLRDYSSGISGFTPGLNLTFQGWY
jgi:putative transposase